MRLERRRRRADRAERAPRPHGLPLREIDGNLTLTTDGITAWYRLAPAQWAYLADSTREQMLAGQALGYIGLAERGPLHLRVTSRPFPTRAWARAMDTAYGPSAVDPKGWADDLTATQYHLRSTSLANHETYLGVPVASRRVVDRLAAAARRGKSGDRERERIGDVLDRVDDAVTLSGLRGVPALQDEVEWLIHRSVGLGMPDPIYRPGVGAADDGDLWGFTDPVDVFPDDGGRLLRLTGDPARFGGNSPVERWVAVLSLGRFEHLDIPGAHDPFVAYSQRLPFPVEWSIRASILSGEQAKAAIQRKIDLVRDQTAQYAKHDDMDEPTEVAETRARATDIRHQMATGSEMVASRFVGTFDLAVSGGSAKEVRDRVRAVQRLYARTQIAVEHHRFQATLYHGFLPGGTRGTNAHQRRGPVMVLAAALPQMSGRVGTETGHYRGWTCGTTRTGVLWDTHKAMEQREASGLTPILGGLGSGKSVLMGSVIYDDAKSGISCTVVDPSGPLARLVQHPTFSGGRGQVVNLLTSGDGILSPWTLVPSPRLEQFHDDPDVLAAVEQEAHAEGYTDTQRRERRTFLAHEAWEAAKTLATGKRRELAADVARMLLPDAMLSNPQTDLAIGAAVRLTGGAPSATMDTLVGHLDHLDGYDGWGKTVATYLRDMSEMPLARLFYRSGMTANRLGMVDPDSEPVLAVITMPGLALPNEAENRRHWSQQERMAVPILHLAFHYASRRIYGLPMRARKTVGLDEAHFLSRWASGRALVGQFNRDSRKWNTRVLVASQKPEDILGMDVASLVSEVWVGRTEDEQTAAGALRLLGVPQGVGYESTLAGLSPRTFGDNRLAFREFLFRDAEGEGRVDKVRIDLAHNPTLAALLDTTAKPDTPTDLREPERAA